MKSITLILVLLSFSLSVVQSQQQATSQTAKPAPVKIDHSQVALVHPASAPDNTQVLESDPRLKIKLTYHCSGLPIEKVLEQLSLFTHVSFVATGNEVKPRPVSCSFVATPAKDILDSIAALGDYEWERRKSGVLVLRVQSHEQIVDKLRLDLEKAGKKFKDLLDKLPSDVQKALAEPYNTPVNSLSPEMRQATLDLLSNLSQLFPSDGNHLDYLSMAQSNLSSVKIGLSSDVQEDGTHYYFSFTLPDGNGGVYSVGRH